MNKAKAPQLSDTTVDATTTKDDKQKIFNLLNMLFMKRKNFFYPLLVIAIVVATSMIVASCNKKFDEPPVYSPPDITPDLSIADLKARHVNGQFEQITDDKIIGGVVIADDESGEFYKTIVIQDSTGGIAVNLDAYDLYTKFPIGRKVFIKVKGLYLGDYNKLVQLGGFIDNSSSPARLGDIPSTQIDQFVIKGTLGNTVQPKLVKVSDLNDSYQNTLIQLDNFEFATTDTSKTFGDPSLNSSAVNFTIKSCDGQSIVLRNSSYANFAGVKVPGGNGSITAIYTVFGTTKQLNIRDTSDVQFHDSRCGGGGTGAIIPIADLRAFYNGSDVTVGSYKIAGVVISDANAGNLSKGSIILQNDGAGVQLYFGSSAATSKFNIGDSIIVDVTGGTLKSFNGSLEVALSSSALPSSAVATGVTITPKELSISDLNSQLPAIEYTLVQIKDATASGGSTYSGNKTLTDATGSITLYTASSAGFAGDALPTDAKTWVGYCNMFNSTKEFQIRNTSDVTDGGGGTNPPPGDSDMIISEYVEGSSNNKYLEIYNAGLYAADLSKYVVKLYTNGGTSASSTAALDVVTGLGTLAPGATIVLKNSSASLTLPAGVTAYNSGVCTFNGDDAITLEKDGVVIDVFGLVGTDPGTSWTIAGNSSGAVDKTVRRKAGIVQGNTDWSISSSSEWDVDTTTDDVSNIGSR